MVRRERTGKSLAERSRAGLVLLAAVLVILLNTSVASSNEPVRIWILSNGVNADLPALQPYFEAQRSSPQYADFSDETGRGTAAASIILQVFEEAMGLSPDDRIQLYSSSRESFPSTTSIFYNPHIIVIDRHIDPVRPFPQEFSDRAEAMGILVIASAGDLGEDAIESLPAVFESTMGIGSADSSGRLPFSNFSGPLYDNVELYAPGEGFEVWRHLGGRTLAQGTWTSAAYVAGLAAALRYQEPGLSSPMALRSRLREAAVMVGDPAVPTIDAAILQSFQPDSKNPPPSPKAQPRQTAIPVSGSLTGTTTWSAGSTIDLVGPTVLESGATLLIEEDVLIRADRDALLEVNGAIDAAGVAEAPVRFEAADRSRVGGLRVIPRSDGLPQQEEVLIATGDLDGDGRVDLVTKQNSSVSWYRGSLRLPVLWETLDLENASAAYPVAGDFDGDSRDEVILGGIQSRTIWLVETIGGELRSTVLHDDLGMTCPPVAADIGADGSLEVVFSSPGDGIHLANRDGAGTWTFRNILPGVVARTLDVADMNGDGRQDVIFLSTGENKVRLLLQDSDQNFTQAPPYDLPTQHVTARLLAPGPGVGPRYAVALRRTLENLLILGDVGNGLEEVGALTFPFRPAALASGDLTGDGLAEILGSDQTDQTHLFWGDYWEQPNSVEVEAPAPARMKIANIVGDATPEVLFPSTNGDKIYEWSAENQQQPVWGGIRIGASAAQAEFDWVEVAHASVVDDSPVGFFRDCLFELSGGTGLRLTASGPDVERCVFRWHRGDGLVAEQRTATGCEARENQGVGIRAQNTVDSEALKNGASGLVAAQNISGSRAIGNGGWGIDAAGTVNDSFASNNENGIRAGAVTDSLARYHEGLGFECGSASGIVAEENRLGVSIGMMSDSIVVGPESRSSEIGDLEDSVLLGAGATGEEFRHSAFLTSQIFVTSSADSIYAKDSFAIGGSVGVESGGTVGNSWFQITQNGSVFSGDSEPDQPVQATNNYWGPAITAQMDQAGGDADILAIIDQRDHPERSLVNYAPYLQNPPENAGPRSLVHLQEASFDTIDHLGVGELVLELKFSGAMDQAQQPSVSFGEFANALLIEPHEQAVSHFPVEPDPGWISADTWRGTFWAEQTFFMPGIESPDFLGLRLANLRDANDRSYPADITQSVNLAPLGGEGENGIDLSLDGFNTVSILWTENDLPSDTQAVVVRRTQSWPEEFVTVAALTPGAFTYRDEGLRPGTEYRYHIDIERADGLTYPWAPFESLRTQDAPGPWIEISRDSVRLSVRAGSQTVSSLVTAENIGTAETTLLLSSDAAWMSTSQAQIPVSADQELLINAEIDAMILEPGLYWGVVTLSSPDALSPERTVSVTLEVLPALADGWRVH